MTYVYPNTIKTYLTSNHLLSGKQFLWYSNTTSTVVRNLTVLSSTTDKINRIRNDFVETWICSKFMWDTTSIKIKNKIPKNYVALIYDEKVPRHFWRIAMVIGVLLVEIRKQKGAILRIKKANAILKHPANKLFPTEYTYHDTNWTDKARKQKLRREAAVIGELKKIWLLTAWTLGGKSSLWTLQTSIF